MNTPTTPTPNPDLPPPAPDAPVLVCMVSDPIVPEKEKDPLVWTLGKPHPFTPGATIVRMFFDSSGVRIYSTVHDVKAGMRDFIPMRKVRVIGEHMTPDVLTTELAAEEYGTDDDEEEEEELPEQPEMTLPEQTNGQPAS